MYLGAYDICVGYNVCMPTSKMFTIGKYTDSNYLTLYTSIRYTIRYTIRYSE